MSLRSGARAQEALERLGHEVVAIDAGPELLNELLECRPERGVHALHGRRRRGRDRAGAAGGDRGALHRLGAGRVHALHRQGARQVPDARGRHPDARTSTRSARARSTSSASRERCRASVAGSGFRWWSSPSTAARRSASSSRPTPQELPRALMAAFSYDDQVVLERYVKGRDLAVSMLDSGDGDPPTREPLALPVVEAIPREQEFYDYESRYEIGMTTFVCPAELPAETTARAQELALAVYRLLGCHGVARVDLMLDDRQRRADGAGDQRRARPHRNQSAAAGRRRRGDRLRRAGRPHPGQCLHPLSRRRRSPGMEARRLAGPTRTYARGRSPCPALMSRPRRSPRARPGRGTP